MNFEVNQTFEFKNKLREIEQLLKEYWNTHPEEHLDKPFRGAFSDELSKVINSMSDNFFEPLLTKGYLSENYLDYLKSNIAVQFHPKYSPALLHEHGFFEIIYVLHLE